MARRRTRTEYLNLTDLCEMIAWYLAGALVKDLAAAYDYPKQHISRLMAQHRVPLRRPTYGVNRYGKALGLRRDQRRNTEHDQSLQP